MKVKMDDLAKELDLSVAAVSMALNDKKGVSVETRAKVIRVAKKMGYVIKKSEIPIAKGKEGNRYVKLIRLKKHGLVAADTAFFTEVIDGIEAESKRKGYQFLMSNHYMSELSDVLFEEANDVNVAGIIIFATELEKDDVATFGAIKNNFVVLDSYFVDHKWNTVLINNYSAVYQAVKYLKSMGHVNIGYLKSNTPIYNFERRFHSYQETMQKEGLNYSEDYLLKLEPTLLGAQRDMGNYLKDEKISQLPSAFLADNDIIAVGAMNALKMNGIQIPEDVSIIGIDDMPFCQATEPKLTTIKIYKSEMGREAVQLLLRLNRQQGGYTQKREINTELMIRDSVRNLNLV